MEFEGSPQAKKLNALAFSVSSECDNLIKLLETLAKETKQHARDVRGPEAGALSAFAKQLSEFRTETMGWGGISYTDAAEYERLRHAGLR